MGSCSFAGVSCGVVLSGLWTGRVIVEFIAVRWACCASEISRLRLKGSALMAEGTDECHVLVQRQTLSAVEFCLKLPLPPEERGAAARQVVHGLSKMHMAAAT